MLIKEMSDLLLLNLCQMVLLENIWMVRYLSVRLINVLIDTAMLSVHSLAATSCRSAGENFGFQSTT